jgi:nitrite reductase (NO-forming)
VLGVTLLGGGWAATGATLVVGGLGVVAWHTVAPLREPLARHHPVVAVAYGAALVEIATGVVLGGMAAAGVAEVIARWALVRPAHAWLTLFGGISLTILATLVYLAPTVYGARIRAGRALVTGLVGIGIGPILTAVAFVLDSRLAALAGIGLTMVGAVGQIGYVLDSRRRRGRYSSEHAWRAVATGHLASGPFWFAAALAVIFADLALGRQLAGWSIGPLAIPLVAGWMLQELVGSWTHLVPSVTPGDPASHARQRNHLAVAARMRLVTWNGAVGLAWVGLALEQRPMAAVGLALLAVSIVVAVATLARALTAGRA